MIFRFSKWIFSNPEVLFALKIHLICPETQFSQTPGEGGGGRKLQVTVGGCSQQRCETLSIPVEKGRLISQFQLRLSAFNLADNIVITIIGRGPIKWLFQGNRLFLKDGEAQVDVIKEILNTC